MNSKFLTEKITVFDGLNIWNLENVCSSNTTNIEYESISSLRIISIVY